MAPSHELQGGDRRQCARDRRRHFRDRRLDGGRFVPAGVAGRLVRWATGPWTSANGLSWFRLAVIIVVVKWGIMELYRIPSSSMEPTLNGDARFLHGDRVAVNKLAYGPRIPFSKRRLIELGKPERWDIVVFNAVAPGSEEKYVIKRIIGLPGERIQIKPTGLLIDGEQVEAPEEMGGVFMYGSGSVIPNADMFNTILDFARRTHISAGLTEPGDERVVTLLEDLAPLRPVVRDLKFWELNVLEKAGLLREVRQESFDLVREWERNKRESGGHPLYGVGPTPRYTQIPEGHYFCLGDNGPESVDSRYFGWVPEENIVGRAFAVAYPPSRMGGLEGFSTTTSGRLLLYGLPIAIAMWELIPGFIAFSWRVRGSIAHLGLQTGDRVIVNRLGFGLRVPFSTKRLWWWRDPKPGDVVCYSLSGKGAYRMDLYFSVVGEEAASAPRRIVVRGPETDGECWIEIEKKTVLGTARSIWWPRGRHGRVKAV